MPDGTPIKAGPAIAQTIDEVRGTFPSDAALQDAIARLTQAGFDRADVSLPLTNIPAHQATPEQGAEDPNTGSDNAQMRTLQASMAGSVGAIAAAGVVIMTGGAALPAVAAAAAVGLGAGAVAHAAAGASGHAEHARHEDAASHGELILAAHVRDTAQRDSALALMCASGATQVEAIVRVRPGLIQEDRIAR